uniref:PsbP C-terminal domain-containing protein n=1 Tax=Calcidiscus leptoporus TaxID=127549 RepID=A0A7S0P6Q2_9EUKA
MASFSSVLACAIAFRVTPSKLKVTAMQRREVLTNAAALSLLPQSVRANTATAALTAPRFSIAPRVTPLPPLGALSRFEDELVSPKGSRNPSIGVRFDFPSQWAPLDRMGGGITYVDSSTGLKAYVLRAPLPGTSLEATPKAWFGDVIFSPEGTIARSGTNIDEYKVSSSKLIAPADDGAAAARRRLLLKYTVITPANQRAVDRRALVDAYEVNGVAYMLMASATASKWEGGERSEKERCERVVDSFFIGSAG